MSVESIITRELDIRFIDARSLTTEAKLNLGIEGYVANDEQRDALVAEATRIFQEERPTGQKAAMKVLNSRLNAIKSSSDHSSAFSCASSSSAAAPFDGESGEFSIDSTSTTGASSGIRKKKSIKMAKRIFSLRRR